MTETDLERRLRGALSARATAVTSHHLRPDPAPSQAAASRTAASRGTPGLRRSAGRWWLPLTAGLAAAAVSITAFAVLRPTEPAPAPPASPASPTQPAVPSPTVPPSETPAPIPTASIPAPAETVGPSDNARPAETTAAGSARPAGTIGPTDNARPAETAGPTNDIHEDKAETEAATTGTAAEPTPG
ncbi:hypothetical protein [Actinoplanes sp. NPDC023714]|uniref:hypothetical protein n=1 Tax=Actinoplanes sp. NPDC023714 TaxID=3154322 RepID=UPI0033DAA599